MVRMARRGWRICVVKKEHWGAYGENSKLHGSGADVVCDRCCGCAWTAGEGVGVVEWRGQDGTGGGSGIWKGQRRPRGESEFFHQWKSEVSADGGVRGVDHGSGVDDAEYVAGGKAGGGVTGAVRSERWGRIHGDEDAIGGNGFSVGGAVVYV